MTIKNPLISTDRDTVVVAKTIRGKDYNFKVEVRQTDTFKFDNHSCWLSNSDTEADILTDLDNIRVTPKQIKLIKVEAINKVYG